ncbi:MAG: sigma-70 family RNA polymerase sigma factor [Silvibacterium sp.]
MFDSERQFSYDSSTKIVASLQAEQSVKARQRDIYESHRHRTFSLAYYMTGNELVAEQLLADTFVRAFRAVQEPEGHDVDAALMEELRQRSYLGPDAPTPFCASSAGSSTGLTGCNVKRTDLEEAIQSLPATDRLLFLLRDVEGYTPAAIAELLKISEAQVQRSLFAARIGLRRILAEAQADRVEAA